MSLGSRAGPPTSGGGEREREGEEGTEETHIQLCRGVGGSFSFLCFSVIPQFPQGVVLSPCSYSQNGHSSARRLPHLSVSVGILHSVVEDKLLV